MERVCHEILEDHPEAKYVLCGGTSRAFLEEMPKLFILNPGDIRGDKDYAIVKLPQNEIILGRIKDRPLPDLKKKK